LDQNITPLFDAVRNFSDWDPVPFFIPAHKLGEGIDPRFKSFAGKNIFRIDLSEVLWTDDFHGAASSIKEAQELAADAWGAAQSHFLVNGTSGGIIAAICSVCGDGDTIIVPRNAHKSAVYGLVLSGATPAYVMPEFDRDLGLIGGLSPEALEKAFERSPDAKAVFTVSPTYHGIMSDTGALAEIAHRHGAVLISDEAHGNHMYFSERLPKGALELGADIVCQSTHKMSGALTQASILHLGAGAARFVDFEKTRANLSMIQTTSPSYILLASLDMARSYIATQGANLLDGVLDALEKARYEISALPGVKLPGENISDLPSIELLGEEIIGHFVVADYEPTRLVFSARSLGLDGYALFRLLREEYGVECEFGDATWCVCVAGLGTTPAHTEALTAALADISRARNDLNDARKTMTGITPAYSYQTHKDTHSVITERENHRIKIAHTSDGLLRSARNSSDYHIAQNETNPCHYEPIPPIPPLRMTPREAWFAEKEAVTFESALGRVSAEPVVPYPPGIPILCPGEVVTSEVHDFLAEQREKGRHLHCAAGDSLQTLSVVK